MAKIPVVVIKFTIFAALVISGGLVIERLARIKRYWTTDANLADDLSYNNSYPLKSTNYDKILSKRYLKCLTNPSKPFCLLSANKRLEVFRVGAQQPPSVEEIENRLHNITADFPSRRRKIHTMLIEFTKLTKAYHIDVMLIEPSMLFCLLSSDVKYSMLAKGFNPGRILGSRNVVTVGVLDTDSEKFEMKNLTSEMLTAGFKIIKFRRWIGEESRKEFETAHYFFILEDVAVHAVVFYIRNDHVWHAGLDPKEIDFEGLLFVNEEIYENFTLSPLNLAGTSISRMFLPNDIRQFMKEMESSKVVKCRTNSSGIAVNSEHLSLTKEQLITRVVIVLKELKIALAPYEALFWLWSESLLGWFTECDIFHFTTSLNLALHFTNAQRLNFSEILADNEFLNAETVTENSKYGFKLDCHGLAINMHFIHEKDGLMWYKYGDDENRVPKFPSLTLCASEIYGQKVQVPCNTTEVLGVEFGKIEIWNIVSTVQ